MEMDNKLGLSANMEPVAEMLTFLDKPENAHGHHFYTKAKGISEVLLQSSL